MITYTNPTKRVLNITFCTEYSEKRTKLDELELIGPVRDTDIKFANVSSLNWTFPSFTLVAIESSLCVAKGSKKSVFYFKIYLSSPFLR